VTDGHGKSWASRLVLLLPVTLMWLAARAVSGSAAAIWLGLLISIKPFS